MKRRVVVAESARIRLVEMGPSDLEEVYALVSDPVVMAAWPKPLTKSDVRAWIARQVKRYRELGYGYWLARSRRGHRPIGQLGLLPVDLGGGEEEVSLGYILHRHAQGYGYATEGAQRILELAHERWGKERVLSLIRPGNGASIRVAERLGMRCERSVEFHNVEHLVYAIGPAKQRNGRTKL